MVIGSFFAGNFEQGEKVMDSFEDWLKISFKEATEKFGFGFAVYIFQFKLPKSFWKKLTYGQWLEIYEACPEGSELKQRALDKTKELSAGNSEVAMSNT